MSENLTVLHCSGLRVRLVVNIDQFFHRNVRVDLGAREASVTEQFLNVTQVSATVQQVCRKLVAQGVGSDIVHAGADADVFLYHPANRTR